MSAALTPAEQQALDAIARDVALAPAPAQPGWRVRLPCLLAPVVDYLDRCGERLILTNDRGDVIAVISE